MNWEKFSEKRVNELFNEITEEIEFERSWENYKKGKGDISAQLLTYAEMKDLLSKEPPITEPEPANVSQQVYAKDMSESGPNVWEQVATWVFQLSRIFHPEFVAADSEDALQEIESEKIFDGKLLLEAELDSNGRCEITFKTRDPGLGEKFFRLSEPVKMLVLLTDEIAVPNSKASVIRFQREHENDQVKVVEKSIGDLIDIREVSEKFESGEITDEIIKNSIFHIANVAGIEAWRRIVQTEGVSMRLREVILEAAG